MAQIKEQLQQCKRINQGLLQKNKLLEQKRLILMQEIEEEHKIVNKYTKQNQALVQKLKAYSISLESIVNIPFYGHQEKDVSLSEQNFLLRTENDKLKKDLSQKQALILNFQARMADTLRNKKLQQQKQLQKWKQKCAKANVQIDQCYQQIQLLNNILQEKMFVSKQQVQKNSNINSNQPAQRQSLSKQTQATRNSHDQLNLEKNYTAKIQSLEEIIQKLNQTISQKDKQALQGKVRQKQKLQELQKEWKRQKQMAQKQVNQLKVKIITHSPQNINSLHLFPPGFIFDEYDHEERLFLLKNLTSYLGPIKRTRLLYRADNYNKVNFHKYVDLQKHVVLIAKTICGKLVAGYSEESFDPQEIKKGYGMILSLWARKVFFCHKGKRAICYDDYFAIFGNSELRIRSLEFKLFSNFAIANSYYDNKGEKVNIILGQGLEREVDLSDYQFYALDLYQ